MTETELDKQTGLVADLTRRVDELQVAADEAVKLKDQMDEYEHYISASCLLWLRLLSAGIGTRLIDWQRQRTSWRSTRRSCRKVQTYATKSE